MLALTIIAFTLTAALVAQGADWSYSGDHGVDKWCDMAKECCGKQQSPINLVVANAVELLFEPFQFSNYDLVAKSFNLTNNGHSVKLTLDKSVKTPKMKGGSLKDEYIFHSLHFHWGSTKDRGSEHQVNGQSFALEMHLVHYNAKYDFSKAIKNSDGLAVLGVLFKESSSNDKAIGMIANNLDKVINKDAVATVSNANLKLIDLLPNTDTFLRYQGSLTTPDCNEIVTWTVFGTVKEISKEQLDKFRQLMGSHGSLNNNYRPPQPLNNRKIYRASPLSSSSSPSVITNMYSASISAVIALAYLYH